MKSMSRIIGIVCVAALLFSMLLGCQQKESTTPTEDKVQQTDKAQQTTDKPKDASLRFSWWGGDSRHEAYLNVIKLYTDQNPHVKIEAEYGGYDGYYQKLITQLSGKTAPDIMQLGYQWVPDFEKQGIDFVDLYTMAEIVETKDLDKKLLEDFFTVNGKLQGLPPGSTGLGMIYNKDFFEKYKIPADTKWTWDKLLEEGKRIHAGDPKAYLLNVNANTVFTFIIPMYLNQINGENWIKADYTFGFEKVQLVEAMNYMKQLLDNGVIQAFEETSLFKQIAENPKWVNGEVGMQIEWASSAPSAIGKVSWNAGATRLPVAEGAKDTAIPVVPAGYVAVNKDSKYVEEAAKFLNFFVNNKEAVAVRGDAWGIPTNSAGRQAAIEAGKINKTAGDIMQIALDNVGLGESTIAYNAEVIEILREATEKTGFGKSMPEQAVEEMFTKLKAKLEELKNKS